MAHSFDLKNNSTELETAMTTTDKNRQNQQWPPIIISRVPKQISDYCSRVRSDLELVSEYMKAMGYTHMAQCGNAGLLLPPVEFQYNILINGMLFVKMVSGYDTVFHCFRRASL